MSGRCVLWLLIVCEFSINLEASSRKLADGSTSAIVNIMKRLQKKGQIRLKRSYIDNRIDTFPTHPAYYSHRRYDSLPSHELHHNFHPPYSLDSAHDIGLDSLDPLNIPDTRARAVPSSPPRSPSFPKQPLEFGPLLFSESDDGQDDGLDFSSLLPSVLDVKTPVSERAAKEADDIMEDFLNFLDLRASGALDQCLKKQKQ